MKSNLFSLQAARVNQSTSVRFGRSACFSFDRNVHFMCCECSPEYYSDTSAPLCSLWYDVFYFAEFWAWLNNGLTAVYQEIIECVSWYPWLQAQTALRAVWALCLTLELYCLSVGSSWLRGRSLWSHIWSWEWTGQHANLEIIEIRNMIWFSPEKKLIVITQSLHWLISQLV